MYHIVTLYYIYFIITGIMVFLSNQTKEKDDDINNK
jgi:hypothetical protein